MPSRPARRNTSPRGTSLVYPVTHGSKIRAGTGSSFGRCEANESAGTVRELLRVRLFWRDLLMPAVVRTMPASAPVPCLLAPPPPLRPADRHNTRPREHDPRPHTTPKAASTSCFHVLRGAAPRKIWSPRGGGAFQYARSEQISPTPCEGAGLRGRAGSGARLPLLPRPPTRGAVTPSSPGRPSQSEAESTIRGRTPPRKPLQQAVSTSLQGSRTQIYRPVWLRRDQVYRPVGRGKLIGGTRDEFRHMPRSY